MHIADDTGMVQHDVTVILQRSLDYIVEALSRGENVEFRNFGVFEVQESKARVGRNPNKPEQTVTIPQRKVVKFKAGKVMKEKIRVYSNSVTRYYEAVLCPMPELKSIQLLSSAWRLT